MKSHSQLLDHGLCWTPGGLAGSKYFSNVSRASKDSGVPGAAVRALFPVVREKSNPATRVFARVASRVCGNFQLRNRIPQGGIGRLPRSVARVLQCCGPGFFDDFVVRRRLEQRQDGVGDLDVGKASCSFAEAGVVALRENGGF